MYISLNYYVVSIPCCISLQKLNFIRYGIYLIFFLYLTLLSCTIRSSSFPLVRYLPRSHLVYDVISRGARRPTDNANTPTKINSSSQRQGWCLFKTHNILLLWPCSIGSQFSGDPPRLLPWREMVKILFLVASSFFSILSDFNLAVGCRAENPLYVCRYKTDSLLTRC